MLEIIKQFVVRHHVVLLVLMLVGCDHFHDPTTAFPNNIIKNLHLHLQSTRGD